MTEEKSIIKIGPLELILGATLAAVIMQEPHYYELAIATYQSFYGQ